MKTAIAILIILSACSLSAQSNNVQLFVKPIQKLFSLGSEIKVQVTITNAMGTIFTLIDDILEKNFSVRGEDSAGKDVPPTALIKAIRAQPFHGSRLFNDVPPNTAAHYEIDVGRFLDFRKSGTYKVTIARSGLLNGGFLSVTSIPVEIRIE